MIVLISPYSSLTGFGLRTLSACLLQAGYETRMIFLPNAKEVTSFLLFDPSEVYDKVVLEQVVELCSDACLVGIGVMTNYFDRAVQLTGALHRCLPIPVIWGGIHPTVRPTECLEHADIVCVGEGERALVDLAGCLANGRPYQHVANLGYMSTTGQVTINPPRPLIQDLDALPFPTFNVDNHYVLHEGQVQPLTPTLLHYYLMDSSATGLPAYPLLSTRGCPHRCSYCANDAYGEVYSRWRYVRRRSNASLVAEIEAAREQFPFVGEVAFYDDVFVAAPAQTIEDFARLYKEKVGLPFYCIVSPRTITERKLKALLNAGLVKISMGIETGSERIQDLYSRPIDNELILKATSLLRRHAGQMLPPAYDIITDNPYEDTEDQLDTLALLGQIRRPYRLLIFSLLFYPGTALYERALADGFVHDEKTQIYDRNYFRIQPTYFNLVIYGFHRQLPRRLLRLMSHRSVFRVFSSQAWHPLWRAAHWVLSQARTWYNKRRLRRFRKTILGLEAADLNKRDATSRLEAEISARITPERGGR